MKLVDVKNDIAFRKIFGNENKKEVLISFLNAVLNFKQEEIINDVEIKKTNQLPRYNGGRATIVDIKATDKKGNTFIVEMQVAEKKDFDKRVLYYASQSYTDQIERGDLYPQLKPTFFIAILNFDITKNENYLSRHKIIDTETHEQVIKNMEFCFIELLKFNKKENELNSIIDQWIYFIKNSEQLELVPELIIDKGLKAAIEEAQKYNWTKEELFDYNKVFIREQDERGRFELGIERAEKKGKIEERLKTAKILKKNGVDIAIIIQATSLTKEEIEKL